MINICLEQVWWILSAICNTLNRCKYEIFLYILYVRTMHGDIEWKQNAEEHFALQWFHAAFLLSLHTGLKMRNLTETILLLFLIKKCMNESILERWLCLCAPHITMVTAHSAPLSSFDHYQRFCLHVMYYIR